MPLIFTRNRFITVSFKFVAIIAIAILGCAATWPPNLPQIAIDAASNLVGVALAPNNDPQQLEIDRVPEPYEGTFLYFDVEWGNPVGSPHIGNFAVNPWTGDVFNTDGCERFTSPSLQSLQANIRDRLGISDDAYLALRVRRPLCSSGQSDGDVNLDGVVDCADVALVKASFGKKTGQSGFNQNADLNNDGVVDVKDLAIVTQQLPAGTKCN